MCVEVPTQPLGLSCRINAGRLTGQFSRADGAKNRDRLPKFLLTKRPAGGVRTSDYQSSRKGAAPDQGS